MHYRFEASLWATPSMGKWVFVSLPLDMSDEIRARTPPRPGFGSLSVEATIGETRWGTSIFPSSAQSESEGRYLLPVKKAVRAAEGVDVGDAVTVSLEVLPIA